MPWKNGNPPLYTVWRSMIGRCYRRKNKQYKDYGGRGITVCPEWRYDFTKFVEDMGPRPSGSSLDREDNNQGYTPKNCRWATRKEQSRNTRVTRHVSIDGVRYVAADLADRCGLKTDTIVFRAKNYPQASLNRILDPRPFPVRDPAARLIAARKTAQIVMAKTHCKRGHEFSEENTYITKLGTRLCRKCDALRARGLHR